MSGRWVVVDDTDPGITYTGPWYEKGQESFSGSTGYGTPWGGSQHGTNGTASLSYTFTGQSIRVFGTSAVTRNLAGNVTDPHWSCTLGTMELQPYKPWSSDINNWPLCEGWAAVTGAGEQTFVLKTWSESGKSNFWIDQIRYLPLPDSTSKLSGKVAVSLEESDPELVYTGQWDDLRIGSLAKATTQAGASVTLNFSGTKVTWVGWKPAGYGLLASQATYSLDGGPATTFDIQGLPNAGDGTQYYQHIFETPEFPAGQHSLTVTYNGGVNSAPLSIDYLVIANGDLPQSVSQSGSGFARESTKLSVQAIVAIVVPVVLLTVCVLFGSVCYFVKWRRRRRGARQEEENAAREGGSSPQETNIVVPPPMGQVAGAGGVVSNAVASGSGIHGGESSTTGLIPPPVGGQPALDDDDDDVDDEVIREVYIPAPRGRLGP